MSQVHVAPLGRFLGRLREIVSDGQISQKRYCVRMGYRGGVLALLIVAACKIGPGIDSSEDARGSKATGAMCADAKECASGVCDLEGYCGQPGCSDDARPCPSGWKCESYSRKTLRSSIT